MPALPPAPLVHRSWLVRGLQSPNPKWAKTGHAILYETPLSFKRASYVLDNTGAFMGAGLPSVYLQVVGHCELETDSGTYIGEPAVAPLERRYYSILMDIPLDSDLIPRKGDEVSFVDQIGTAITIRVAKCDIPEGWSDHLEIETEEWQ